MNSNQSEILKNYPIYTRENYYTQYEYDEDQKRRLYLAIQKKNIKDKLRYFLCNRHKKY